MIVFPNAKINLGLKVLRKRPDGYHDLETLFYPVPVQDVLEIVKIKSLPSELQERDSHYPTKSGVQIKTGEHSCLYFSFSGIDVDGVPENNLCVKACMAFASRFSLTGDLWMHLHKVIPPGSGLGAGSADAAFTLELLNRLHGFPAEKDELMQMASKLGSDCPFFLLNEPAVATGRGEILEAVDFSLKGYYLVVVVPPEKISTAEAFKTLELTRKEEEEKLQSIIWNDIHDWQKKLVNDFEKPVFQKFPHLAIIKEQLIRKGAVYASMSGSGSALFGLFRTKVSYLDEFKNCTLFSSWL